jgi:hypothetical protein
VSIPPRPDVWRRCVALVVLGAVLYAVSSDSPEVQPLALALIPAALVRALVQSAGYLRSGAGPGAVLMETLVLVALVLAFAQLFERLGWGTR